MSHHGWSLIDWATTDAETTPHFVWHGWSVMPTVPSNTGRGVGNWTVRVWAAIAMQSVHGCCAVGGIVAQCATAR